MELNTVIAMFDTLAQETRLEAFRLLVKAGHTGLAAGAISESLSIPHNTLSFHLSHMTKAGLLSSTKQGRSVIYSANFEAVHQLIQYMIEDCCSDDFVSMRNDKNAGCSIIEMNDFC